ncbi:MAG: arsenate reductase [Cellvibrionaceae bacterium]|nr:arsenate reductase [Cellvibrionaceae bacterium]
MNTAKLFGIKNCDTVKKARRWLDGHNIEYHFVDFKQQPPSSEAVQTWISALGADKLLNKRSTTWKSLSDAEKAQAEGRGLPALICDHPTLIKRPVLQVNQDYWVGFSEASYTSIFT